MHLLHNRLFFFLPLLLFAWTTPALAAQAWTTVWTPDSALAPSSGEGHLGQGSHKSNTNRPPCTEWDEYEREWKKIYDPETQGCCVHPDTGEETITDKLDAENVNMDEYAEENGYCEGLKFGVTFCYNGSKVSTVCAYGNTFPPEYRECIQAHEECHKNYPDSKCVDCDAPGIQHPTYRNKFDDECLALAAIYRCLEGKDPSNVNYRIMYNTANALYDEYGCTFTKGE